MEKKKISKKQIVFVTGIIILTISIGTSVIPSLMTSISEDTSSDITITIDTPYPYYIDIPMLFHATFSDPIRHSSEQYQYEWDFGDGDIQNGRNEQQHMFTDGILKKVSLVVRKDDKIIASNETSFEVSPVKYISQFGHFGSGNKEFHVANGIAMNSKGNLYITDQVNNRIQVFDEEGNFLEQIGGKDDPNGISFESPHGIIIDKNDNIYIADLGKNRIVVLDSNGKLKFTFGSFCNALSGEYCYDPDEEGPLKIGDGQFHAPYNIALDGHNNIYVTDVTSHFVQKFDSNGKFLKKWGGPGTANDQFISPHGIAIDHNDHVYIADHVNNRIQIFNSDGDWINSIINESNKVSLDEPRGLFIYNNNMYVTNGGTRQSIVAFDLTNNSRLYEFGSYCNTDNVLQCRDLDGENGALQNGDMGFNEPHNLIVNNNKIFVTDGFNHRVEVFLIKQD